MKKHTPLIFLISLLLVAVFSEPIISAWNANKTSVDSTDTIMFSDNSEALGSREGFITFANLLAWFQSNLTFTTNTDNQTVTTFNLDGTDLTLALSGGNTVVVDLSTLQDGIGTDDQTITAFSLNPTTHILTLTLENGNTVTEDLSGLVGGGLADAPSDGTVYARQDGAWVAVTGSVTVDSTIQDGSTNPVQNDAIYDALAGKVNTADVQTITPVFPINYDSGNLSIDTTGSTTGQVLKRTASGIEWADDSTAAGAGYVATPWTYSDETCIAGQYAFSSTLGYVCVSSGDIKTFALTSWSNPTPTSTDLEIATAHIISYDQFSKDFKVAVYDATRTLVAVSNTGTVSGNGDGTTPTEYTTTFSAGSLLATATTCYMSIMATSPIRLQTTIDTNANSYDAITYDTFTDPLPTGTAYNIGKMALWVENAAGDVICGVDNTGGIYSVQPGTRSSSDMHWDTAGHTVP